MVKLFGYFPGWRESIAAETAANRAIERIHGISAPRIVATGSLFPGRDDEWPFLVMERLDGLAWREAALEVRTAESVADTSAPRFVASTNPDRLTCISVAGIWLSAHGQQAAERHQGVGLTAQAPHRPDPALS